MKPLHLLPYRACECDPLTGLVIPCVLEPICEVPFTQRFNMPIHLSYPLVNLTRGCSLDSALKPFVKGTSPGEGSLPML